MSQMDDILSEQDKEAVQQIVQEMQSQGVEPRQEIENSTKSQDKINEERANNDSNTSGDSELARSLPDEQEKTSQIDQIEAERGGFVEKIEQERAAEKDELSHER